MNERVEAHLDRGRRRFEAGDLEGAVDDFTQAVNLAPDEAQPYVARASVLARKLDLDGAIHDVRKALDLAPSDWEARGEVESMLQKLEIRSMTLPASLREFAARRKYPQLTEEILASIPDDKLVQAVVDHVGDFRVRGDAANQRKIVDGLTSGLGWFYAMFLAEAEIEGGGFAQYLPSPAAELALEALEGYRRIGSPREDVIARALAALKATNRKELDAALAKIRKAGRVDGADGLDASWHGLPDDHSYKVAYIRANIEHFI